MTEYFQYYKENLYPIQDKVLTILKNCNSPFYLTGGTALSRGYYNHRFSDDLDFFVNAIDDFYPQVENLLACFEKSDLEVNTDKNYSSPDFVRISVTNKSKSARPLKIDFVNDIPVHFGDLCETPVFYKTDSILNILTNKYTALYRISAKDVVDIREICLHEKFDWDKIISMANQKEGGIELNQVCDILTSFSDSALLGIKWIEPPTLQNLRADLENIARDMLLMRENSLR